MKRKKIRALLGLVIAAGMWTAGCSQKQEPPVVTEEELLAEQATGSNGLSGNRGQGVTETEQLVLPRAYDLREQGKAFPIENQGDSQKCWTYASLTALEHALLPEEVVDFSEDHMADNPNFALGQELGGDYTMSMAYLLSWEGPVSEERNPYAETVPVEKHIQEIRILPERDLDAIKRAVFQYGGVQTSLYTDIWPQGVDTEYFCAETSGYCCLEQKTVNHDIVIIGWDDDFPKEAFHGEVPQDGAFLCENSWGEDFADGGCFYVSYADVNIGRTSLVYTKVEATDNYDTIYQSDLCGWIGQLGYGSETAWGMNVYTASQNEWVEAVGFYAIDRDTDYEVYLVSDVAQTIDVKNLSTRKLLASGHLDDCGYYTIPLEYAVSVSPNERFGVMVKLTTPNAVHPLAVEYDAGDGKCVLDLTDGEGYISPDGEQWQSVEETQDCNLCLKAYTSFALPDTP